RATEQHDVSALIRADLCGNIVGEGLVVGKVDLAASGRSAAGRRVRSAGAAFGPNTEARDRFACGGVRVKLSLQILQVEREVQNVLLVNFIVGHESPPISSWSCAAGIQQLLRVLLSSNVTYSIPRHAGFEHSSPGPKCDPRSRPCRMPAFR